MVTGVQTCALPKSTATNATNVTGVAGTLGYSTASSTISLVGAYGGPQVMGSTTNAAMLTLHRVGSYAVNFGIDTDNKLKVGGSSMGAVAYDIYHAGNPQSSVAGSSGSCTGNAATATTATNQSGGSVNATTGAFSGAVTFPSSGTTFEIKTGTGDGASSTVYNTTIRSWWGIGFRDNTNSTTVKAYIDTRTGLISSCGGGSQDETRLYSNGTTSEIRFGGTTTTNVAARITYDRSNAAFEFFTGTAATPARRVALTNVGMYVDYLAGTGVRTVTASAGGLLSTSSDSRLKTEVFTPLPSLAEVLQLKTHAFKWNEDIDYRGDEAAVEIGFFANETVNVIPSSAPMNADGYYGFFDRPIVAALVNAVKEQNALITALTARVTALET